MDLAGSLYDELGVTADADVDTLRAAYRSQAKLHHPDHDTAENPAPAAVMAKADKMAALNEAWAVLSDPDRRADYDRSLAGIRVSATASGSTVTTTTYAPEPPKFARRDAWVAGLRVQIARLTREAVSSAAWALSLKRHGRPREVYLAQMGPIVAHVIDDTAERMRFARSCGTAPLDLALATALVGLGDMAHETWLDCRVAGPTPTHEILAEVIDRTWDNLAHEISHEVEVALGGNPHLSRAIARR